MSITGSGAVQQEFLICEWPYVLFKVNGLEETETLLDFTIRHLLSTYKCYFLGAVGGSLTSMVDNWSWLVDSEQLQDSFTCWPRFLNDEAMRFCFNSNILFFSFLFFWENMVRYQHQGSNMDFSQIVKIIACTATLVLAIAVGHRWDGRTMNESHTHISHWWVVCTNMTIYTVHATISP